MGERVTILHGDCREVLPTLPAASVQCCVTSPPYFGLRDYGVAGQIGLEPTPDAYVAQMVAVFREVKRVLRDDATLWLNLGDSFASGSKGSGGPDSSSTINGTPAGGNGQRFNARRVDCGLPDKNLLGIPWRVAFALQADGWYLRQDIIWHKPNPMPESVTDRCTKAHEYLFLLSKSARYFYDADAIAEPAETFERQNTNGLSPKNKAKQELGHFSANTGLDDPYKYETRNARSVWTIASQPYSEAHFAVFPAALPERCIKAGSRPGDTILDPFSGAGTTGLVADRLQRHYIGIELNDSYRAMSQERIRADAPLFAGAAP